MFLLKTEAPILRIHSSHLIISLLHGMRLLSHNSGEQAHLHSCVQAYLNVATTGQRLLVGSCQDRFTELRIRFNRGGLPFERLSYALLLLCSILSLIFLVLNAQQNICSYCVYHVKLSTTLWLAACMSTTCHLRGYWESIKTSIRLFRMRMSQRVPQSRLVSAKWTSKNYSPWSNGLYNTQAACVLNSAPSPTPCS